MQTFLVDSSPLPAAVRTAHDSRRGVASPAPPRFAEAGGYQDLEPLLAEMASLPRESGERARLREALICRCLPLAGNIAAKFRGRGEPYEDIVQVARVGLVVAVDRFDPAHGAKFLSFAVPTITGEIRRHFRDHTLTLRVPRPIRELYVRIVSVTAIMEQRLGRTPTIGELAVELDADPAAIADAIAAGNTCKPISLDGTAFDDGDVDAADTVGDIEPAYGVVEDTVAVARHIAALPERKRRVLKLRFLRSMTQAEIAEAVGLSQMQVSRILTHTLAVLRERACAD